MMSINLDAPVVAIRAPGYGHVAGEAPGGVVTIDNVPGRAEVDLLRRSDHAWIARRISRDDGTYRFGAVPVGVEYDVIGRDVGNAWDDVIVGRVTPYEPIAFAGDAPGCSIGVPYAYSFAIAGGAPPYAFTLTGELPAGLALATTDTTLQITGTALPGALAQTFQIQAEDSRGTVETITDTIGVFPAGAHRYWRINASAGNNHLSAGEIEMAASSGGVDQCVGGVAIASGYYPSWGGYTYLPANAFDDVLDGQTNCWASDVSTSGWIGYVFPDPVLVAEVRICPRSLGTQSPRTFTIECSDDGIAWTVKATVTNKTSWAFNVFTAFPVPA